MQAIVLLVALTVCVAAPSGTQSNEQVYKPGNGVTDPVLVKEVKPVYTDDARQRKVQGSVELSAVVRADGSVGDTKVTRSLDPGLDQEAIKAAKQWRFKPGTREGKPVNVRVNIEMTFTLRETPIYRPPFVGVTAPKAVKTVNPEYEETAKQERIQGSVELEGVVETDGTVTGIHVTKSLDKRLDRQAEKAFAQWTFSPGLKDGIAVRAFVRAEMTFTLK